MGDATTKPPDSTLQQTVKVDNFKFEVELNYIRNTGIREFVRNEIELIPDYFWEIPASSTGKYHPAYALGVGGLYRHTRAAIMIAIELMKMEEYTFTEDERDLIIASLILHDTRKNGIQKENYTVVSHPTIASTVLLSHKEQGIIEISDMYLIPICANIESHMGQWNKDYKTNEIILPLPMTTMQKFVHLCDYLASRKCIEINFNA